MTIYVSDQLQATAAAVSGVPTPDTSWQWLRNGAPISGATSSVYYATADDLGTSISVVQSAINMLGTATATSAADGPVLPFLPSLLFRNAATKGVWYDPSDTTTLFQDAAGTTPVTAVEQPVGLMLDKSKGLVLGPELVTNGTFDSSINGWTTNSNGSGSSVWIENSGNGAAKITNISGQATQFSQALAVTAGKTYHITANITYISGSISGNVSVRTSANASTSSNLGGQTLNAATNTGVSFYYLALSTTTVYVASLAFTSACSYSLDNISVRELPGNHAFNSSGNSANFPVLSARYNLLTKTEQFDDAAWAKNGLAITANTAVAPDGTMTADKIVADTTSGFHYAIQNPSVIPLTAYTISCYFKQSEYRYAYIYSDSAAKGSIFDLLTLTVTGNILGAPTKAAIVDAGNGWSQCSITVTVGANGSSSVWFGPSNSGTSASFTGDGTSGIYIWGADLRVANDALNQSAYQRVNTSTDYDTVGFKPYLRFNGTNQWLQTNSIDFSYGDKMFVCAGVRKIDDTVRVIYEFGTSTDVGNGGFILHVQSSPVGYRYAHSGNTAGLGQDDFSIFPAPLTNVITTISDLSGLTVSDELSARVNGVAPTQSKVGTASTGVFGNRQIYIGARAGSSFWFNGRLYQMVVAGKQASATEITSTETYINQKTGAF